MIHLCNPYVAKEAAPFGSFEGTLLERGRKTLLADLSQSLEAGSDGQGGGDKGWFARRVTAAIVTGLVWTQVVETTLLQGSVPNLAKWLPTEAAVALTPGTSTAHLLAPLTAACVLVGWAMALAAAATRFSVRGDVR